MKDFKKADAVHPEESKHKEDNNQWYGRKTLEKGDNKSCDGKNKNKKSQGNSNQGKCGHDKSKF